MSDNNNAVSDEEKWAQVDLVWSYTPPEGASGVETFLDAKLAVAKAVELGLVATVAPPPAQPGFAPEDFHIFYEPAMDELMIKFYGNGNRIDVNHSVDGYFSTLRDRSDVLTGITIEWFLRKILPDLLCAGEIGGPLGHIHIVEPKEDAA